MPAAADVASATERTVRTATSSSATTPFLLSRPHGTVSTDGIAARFSDVHEAAHALRTGRVTALAGALPFAPDHAVALTAPRALTVSPAPHRASAPALPHITITGTRPSEDEHLARVTAALSLLRSDDHELAKIVLARTLSLRADAAVDPLDLFTGLSRNSPARNAFLVDLSPAGHPWHGHHLLGSSPEVLVRRQGDLVTAHPLAGSAPRHHDPDVDRERSLDLASSAKNLAEHAHVVDDLRAALEPLCTDLEIPDRPTLTSTTQLWHLGTPVSGRLRDTSVTALDLALAVHPTPAICGTPTATARDLITEIEGDRGFYAGAVGWCDADGDGEWMVTIRCAVLDADHTGLVAYAGGGIVADSDPADELTETTVKFGTVLDSFGVQR